MKREWDWDRFLGSQPALKYARRDLPTLDRAISLSHGRDVCVQAGGCLGVFAKRLAEVFHVVHCFEPSADLFPLMYHNAPERNILRYQAALGRPNRPPVSVSQTRRDGKLHRYPHEGITHVTEKPGVVPTLTIDAMNMPSCDLVVLDLEGYELEALHGASITLSTCRPVVMVEINDNCEAYGHTRDEVRGVLSAHRYRLVFREHSDEVYVPNEKVAA